LQLNSELIGEIVGSVHDAIFASETARVQTQPLPTLQSYSLMLGGIQLLHRSSRHDFSSSFDIFEHLARNHPRAPEPRVWQAQWYALRAIQGLTSDRSADARAALACTAQALQAEPNNAFALAMEGFVHCHLTLDFDAAAAALEQSVTLNPSETFGHLFRGITMALKHDYEAAIGCYEKAVSNSPLDPAMYMFETIGAYLCLSAGRLDQAITLAQRSLRLNRTHAHSWRILTIAQAESSRIPEARASLRELLKLQPDLTVRRYLSGQRPDDLQRRRFSEGLRAAGLPAS
jgi:tetratricopeptide (TPR) repeat protein